MTAFRHPADLVARVQGAQENGIVQHRERRSESSDQILHPEGIDAVLHPDAGIVLPQHRGRNADVANTAMRGGGDETDQVQQCTAADTDHEGMAIDAQFKQVAMQSLD